MTMTLDSLNQFIRGLPAALVHRATPKVAEGLHAALLVTIRAHQAPDGTPWKPRKRGTKPVLNNAAQHFTAEAIGNRVWLVVRGINGRHHKGAVRGSVQRPIIIYKKHGMKAITPRLAAAIHAAVRAQFDEELQKASAAA